MRQRVVAVIEFDTEVQMDLPAVARWFVVALGRYRRHEERTWASVTVYENERDALQAAKDAAEARDHAEVAARGD